MEQYTLSLTKTSKGQILIEALLVITFLLAFLMLLQGFHSTAQKQIQKERLSKQNKSKQAPWLQPFKKGEE
ncbi:MAG: hypothetical protein OXN83_02645 [Oligoflexia bacterium]|nr:hypothetical protein [Oligoflexia bacterium]